MKPARDAYNNIIARFKEAVDASFTARKDKYLPEYVDRVETLYPGAQYWIGEWDIAINQCGFLKTNKINATVKCYIECDIEHIYHPETRTCTKLFQKRRPYYLWTIWVGKSAFEARFYHARLKDAIAFVKALRTFTEWNDFEAFIRREAKKADETVYEIRKIDKKNMRKKENHED